MFEESIILWLLVAILTAFLAVKKNRSFIGWLIIGLVIPVVGLVLAIVLPEGKEKQTQEAATSNSR